MNVKDIKLAPAQWLSLLQSYGVPESALTGKPAPCPVPNCGGTDRFTYDNKRGRGDWVCRKCNNGAPMAGDGFQLICRVAGISFFQLMRELEGGSLDSARTRATSTPRSAAPTVKRKPDRAYVESRLTSMWDRAKPLAVGDLAMRYLQARVPGLTARPSTALRLGMLEYRYEKKIVLGTWPGILARFELPDGRLGTLHRTFLERSKPAKATVISPHGEILDSKLNDLTLNPLAGGAVRLMEPVDGEIGVAEGLETTYAAHMLFGVPMWYCLNRVHLAQFVVPEGLGIRVVHIFVDFDEVDPKTGKSPGVDAGIALAKRLRAEGYTAIVHRPKKRGTDFADEWGARVPLVAAPASASVVTPRQQAVAVA
jgi:putative DNA primase/helicase